MTNVQRCVDQLSSGSPTDLNHQAILGAVYALLIDIARRGQPERDAADDSAPAPGGSGADLPRRKPARREGRATA